jgi:hypothetical protein
MEYLLWSVQIVLALMLVYVGVSKFTQARDKRDEGRSGALSCAAGTFYILFAVGLVLPMATGVLPEITLMVAIMAGGFAVLAMLSGKLFGRKTNPTMNVAVGILAAVILVGHVTADVIPLVRHAKKTYKDRTEFLAWQARHDVNAPKKGDMAPDFELLSPDGESSFRLSDYRGKQPVGIIFGSFT